MNRPRSQPRVRRNDWSSLDVPALGTWEPTLSVSVVIPAYGAQRLLPHVLAGLAAQTYPTHLLEVVVADDDPRERLELPELEPFRARGPGIYYRLVDEYTGALATPRTVGKPR